MVYNPAEIQSSERQMTIRSVPPDTMSEFHNFPPAAIRKDGKPLLSWRVALLPYLDQQALYEKFHLDEPLG
jgi:hypothetical protein